MTNQEKEKKKPAKIKKKREKLTLPQMEFNDALRKILSVKPDKSKKKS